VDRATVIGLIIGIAGILGGNALEGGSLYSLLQLTAAMVVIGGTMGATMISFPLPVFIKAFKDLRTIFAHKPRDLNALVDEIATYAQQARRDGLVSLEQAVKSASDPFLTKAMMMAIDGSDSKLMRENLELMLSHTEEELERSAKVWEAAGGYSPTIGIIGAVMGLILVMQNLEDVAEVGKGIAVAFVATIYGVASANIFYLPAASKLKVRAQGEVLALAMMIEGAIAIQEGQNPTVIRDKLQSFFAGHEAQPEPRRTEAAA
jgi:chemotaxis protein MotA